MPNVAVLIDAENVLPIFADQIFTHASSLGAVTHKEIYGAAAALNAWVEPVLKYAIRPSLTIRPSKYKNTSDIALVIGAMDLLAGKSEPVPDIVVIASSDSDFSALSVRLRTGGVDVVGMGTDKSNELWRTACTSFVVLQQPSARAAAQSRKAEPARPAPERKPEKAPEKNVEKNAEKNAEKAPEKTVKITPTHSGRIANIRAFILNQLAAREGRMPSHALFALLNDLPDYRYDQQRSKRKPLDYLARQMGGALKIEEAEGGTWVSAAAPETTEAVQEAPEAVKETPQPEQEAPETPAPAQEPESTPQPEPQPQEPDPIALLIQAGAPDDAARKIAAICTESTDRRAVYNKLRKAFGTADARKYLQILKEAAGEA
ncbi:MAG: NYN domain-containing protein [Clostridia bacterium]|nr:NYN domain-containing protein [Clostridia bacterium]